MARLGSWIEVPSRGDLRAPGGRVDRPVAAQGRRRWSPTAIATTRAAGTARCWPRPRRWRSWKCAAVRRTARRSLTTRRSGSATSTCASCPPATCSARAQIVLEHAGERVVVSGDYKRRPDPTCPPSCRCRATSSSPRRRSAFRCSAIPTPAARSTGCCTGCTRTRAAACWSAPMRWARRSASSASCARAATTTRSISTARSSG